MATSEVYGRGGFDITKPNNNVIERFDGDAGTYTKWVDGSVVASRPLTADEADRLIEQDSEGVRSKNAVSIASAAKNALSANATFLAIGTPTNAQVAAQVRALTQQNNKIIRVVLGVVLGDRSQLDATS